MSYLDVNDETHQALGFVDFCGLPHSLSANGSPTREQPTPEATSTTQPCLYLCLECDRPLAGGARFELGQVDEVVITRATARSFELEVQAGRRRLVIGVPDVRISSQHALLTRRGQTWLL